MIDTHCHLNFKAFQGDWRDVVDRAVANGVSQMIVVGTNLETSVKAVELAKSQPNLFASVGIHPHHAKEFLTNELITKLNMLAQEPTVVAIGEVGLDYHLEITPELKERQRELFIKQVKLAVELNKPLILHSREAKEEVLQIINEISLRESLDAGASGHSRREISGVFHCFGGSKQYAKRILAAGYYLGFDGDITYVPDRLAVASTVPLNRLLLETDSPFLTPLPKRGERNEPANLRLLVIAHANVRGVSEGEIDRVTTENAKKLFRMR